MIYCHTPMPCPATATGYAKRVFKPGKRFTHLTADTEQELIDYVVSIGMRASWLQHGGTRRFHFDLTGKFLEIAMQDKQVVKFTRRQFVERQTTKGVAKVGDDRCYCCAYNNYVTCMHKED